MSATSQQSDVTLSVPEGAKTIDDTLPQGRYHIVLGLSPEVNETIEKLALRYRRNKADVINLAIGLLNLFSDAAAQGKRIGIAGPDQELENEITGL